MTAQSTVFKLVIMVSSLQGQYDAAFSCDSIIHQGNEVDRGGLSLGLHFLGEHRIGFGIEGVQVGRPIRFDLLIVAFQFLFLSFVVVKHPQDKEIFGFLESSL